MSNIKLLMSQIYDIKNYCIMEIRKILLELVQNLKVIKFVTIYEVIRETYKLLIEISCYIILYLY